LLRPGVDSRYSESPSTRVFANLDHAKNTAFKDISKERAMTNGMMSVSRVEKRIIRGRLLILKGLTCDHCLGTSGPMHAELGSQIFSPAPASTVPCHVSIPLMSCTAIVFVMLS